MVTFSAKYGQNQDQIVENGGGNMTQGKPPTNPN